MLGVVIAHNSISESIAGHFEYELHSKYITSCCGYNVFRRSNFKWQEVANNKHG